MGLTSFGPDPNNVKGVKLFGCPDGVIAASFCFGISRMQVTCIHIDLRHI